MTGEEKKVSQNNGGNSRWLQQHVFSIKTLSLVILSVQTSTMVLLLRYSRNPSTHGHQNYIITTAVLLSEIMKMLFSLAFLHFQTGKVMKATLDRLYRDVLLNFIETMKLAIPAFLYVVQNNLLFVALSNLDAATYQVTYQLKILTTAIFSWVILGKRLTPAHWLSLCFLMLGVSLVQVESNVGNAKHSNYDGKDVMDQGKVDGEVVEDFPLPDVNAAHPNTDISWFLGIFAVFVSCVSSGFSGVYFERLVKKGAQPSLAIRNIQLGTFSIFFAVIAVSGDWSTIKEGGFFQGYTITTWGVVLIQAFGGLIVSVTMKYADNILKGFATSLSIVMCTLFSWLVFGEAAPTTQFIIGTTIVITSTVLYGFAPHPPAVQVWNNRHGSSDNPHKVSKRKKVRVK